MRLDEVNELTRILGPAHELRCLLITPVFNDFACAQQLLCELELQLSPDIRQQTAVILVDDGSTERPPSLTLPANLKVYEMTLRANLGHQRAIAVALGTVSHWLDTDAVLVVLDCDGEDLPTDVPRLLKACSAHPNNIVVADRTRRSESFGFRIGYQFYRGLYRVLTGHPIRHGNFSAMTAKTAVRLAYAPSLWNHYAATLYKSRIPVTRLEVCRGTRYEGQSSMNFVGLVAHGLSAISVHIEAVGVRLLLAFLLLSGTAILASIAVASIRLFTNLAIPGWASTVVGLLFVVAALGLASSVQLIFMVLAARERRPTIAALDSARFVRSIVRAH